MKDTLVQRKRKVVRRSRQKEDNVAYIKWITKSSGEWGKLLLSTSRDQRDAKYSPLPMTFGNLSVAFVNNKDNLFATYASLPVNNEGLSEVTIKVVNSGDETKIIDLSTEVINSSSGDFEIFFISNSQLYENGSAEISIPAGQSKEIAVVSGARSDLNSNKLIINNYNFAILNSFPNPFKAMINLRYRLPKDIKELKIDMFNSLGRKVYTYNEHDKTSAGNYMHTVNTNDIIGSKISSGAYIVKLTAVKNDGKKLSLEKKAICIK